MIRERVNLIAFVLMLLLIGIFILRPSVLLISVIVVILIGLIGLVLLPFKIPIKIGRSISELLK